MNPTTTTATTTPVNGIVQTVADAVFAELQVLTAGRPLLALAVAAIHQLLDAAFVARVSATVAPAAAATSTS